MVENLTPNTPYRWEFYSGMFCYAYPENIHISEDDWEAHAEVGDVMHVLVDQENIAWLGVHTRMHADLSNLIKTQTGKQTIWNESQDLRIQLFLDLEKKAIKFSVPFSITDSTIETCIKIIHMIPQSFRSKDITIFGSSLFYRLGKNEFGIYKFGNPQTYKLEEDDIRVEPIPETIDRFYLIKTITDNQFPSVSDWTKI